MAGAIGRGVVTLLLADVEGSTSRWDEDPVAAASAITELHRLVDALVTAHGGERPVEQGEGDSFVALFPSASSAVAVAVGLQAPTPPGGLRVRIGLHTGEPEHLGDGRIGGPVLHRCARIRDLGHGGQTLVSAATRELVVDVLPEGVELVERGRHRLRGLSRPEEVWELRHPGVADEFPPLRSIGDRPGNLPAELDRFIGRSDEVADIAALIEHERLVTLTGAGGCGKTRLAIRAAAAVQQRFEHGVWFADLAQLPSPELVAEFVADVVGTTPRAGQRAVEALTAKLAGSRALVVLDNCEHVVDACADLAREVLGTCPHVVVLATSREPLGVAGELAWRVPSLAALEATELFAERASRARPGFEIDDTAGESVATICTRLDGIPLAIELAAARVRVMSPAAIASGLEDRFRLLVGSDRSIPRHRTLAASVEWSHSLLGDAERRLLRRLAVFVGGFTLDAAEAVCAADDRERHAVLDLLARLVDRSLVGHDVDVHGADRYRMLETIRQYGEERLVEAGEAEATRDRHLRYLVDLAESSEPHLGRETNAWVDRLDVERHNTNGAIDWALARDAAQDAARIVVASAEAWRDWGRAAETHRVIDRVRAASAGMPEALRGRLLVGHVFAAVAVGELESALASAEEAVDIARTTGGRWTPVALVALGHVHVTLGNFAAARPLYLEAIQPGQGGTVTRTALRALVFLSWVTYLQGDTNAARALSDEALAGLERVGARHDSALAALVAAMASGRGGDLPAMRARIADLEDLTTGVVDLSASIFLELVRSIHDVHTGQPDAASRAGTATDELIESGGFGGYRALATHVRALLAAAAGRVDDAERFAGRALALDEQSSDRAVTGWLRVLAGEVSLARDDLAAARTFFQSGLEASAATGDAHHGALNRRGLAVLARRAGDLDEAARVLVEVLASVSALGGWIDIPDTLESLAGVFVDAGEDIDAARLLAAADGARERLGCIRSGHRARVVETDLAAVRAALDVEAFDAAWTESRALSLDEAVSYATRGTGRRLRPPTGWHSLTPVESDVARLVAEGLSNPTIATRLFVSRNTVKTHLSHIFDKLGVTSRAELAAEVTRHRTG